MKGQDHFKEQRKLYAFRKVTLALFVEIINVIQSGYEILIFEMFDNLSSSLCVLSIWLMIVIKRSSSRRRFWSLLLIASRMVQSLVLI